MYSIVKRSVENRDINFFAMRSRFNPELGDYITRLDEEKTDDEIMALFRQRKYRKEPLFAKIGDWAMLKRELLKLLEDVPDDAQINIINEYEEMDNTSYDILEVITTKSVNYDICKNDFNEEVD